jgi:hypothetical protein
VTDGSDGDLKIFNGTSYELLKTVELPVDSDATGYDPVTHNLYIADGGLDAKLSHTFLEIVKTKKCHPLRNHTRFFEQFHLRLDRRWEGRAAAWENVCGGTGVRCEVSFAQDDGLLGELAKARITAVRSLRGGGMIPVERSVLH